MLKEHEDDTKSFQLISRIYDILVLHRGVHWSDFNIRWKSATAVKKALADKVFFCTLLKSIKFCFLS